MKKRFNTNISAFSLIEMSIVLVVIGIIAGAVFKGQELLESAKLRSVAQDFQHYSLSVSMYQETYQALPGDDPKAKSYFSDTQNGDGNGQITGAEVDLFWQHLGKSQILSTDIAPSSKFGGRYKIVFQPYAEMSGHWLMLSKEDDSGLLTPKQAQALKNKIDQGNSATNPSEGQLVVKDAKNAVGRCISNSHLNLATTTPDCVVYYKL